MNPIQDGITIENVCNGRSDDFRLLVEAYQDQIFAIAFARLRDRELAQEAVQETFINAYVNLRGLRRWEKFGPWLCAIARRSVLTLLRKRKREAGGIDLAGSSGRETGPVEEVQRREVSDVLQETLGKLPVRLAETLTLFYMQEKNVSETAAILGVSEAAVRTRLHRGRELMRRPLEKILDEELSQLKPSGNLTPGIMTILLDLPMKSFWAASWSLISASCFISLLLGYWLARQSFKNLDDYRWTLCRNGFIRLFPFMGIYLLYFYLLVFVLPFYMRWEAVLIIIVAFAVFISVTTLPSNLRNWKIGNKTFVIQSLILEFSGWFLICSLIFFPLMTSLKISAFFIMPISTIVILWRLVFFFRKDKHLLRGDLSLFLRAVKKELPVTGGEARPLKLSDAEWKKFVRFLRREIVILGVEYASDGSHILELMNVDSGKLFPRSFSKVRIDSQGNVTANLSGADLGDLEKIEKRMFSETEIAALEQKVADAIRASGEYFSQGELDQARKALSTVSENEIFKKGVYGKTPVAIFFIVILVFIVFVAVNNIISFSKLPLSDISDLMQRSDYLIQRSDELISQIERDHYDVQHVLEYLDHSQGEIDPDTIREMIGRDYLKTPRCQDIVMSRWPKYEQMREQLLNELADEYPLENLSSEEMVAKAFELREEFWRIGGNLSLSAWEPGYKARLLAELAVEKAPDNLIVIDELVETLQSIMPLAYYPAPGFSKELHQMLTDLRKKQYEQLKAEIADGRKAELNDFVRCADLIYLVQRPFGNEYSREILQLMKAMCEENGWSKFMEISLQHIETSIEKETYIFLFSISIPRNSIHTLKYGSDYSRRLPSFRGPAERNTTLLEVFFISRNK